MTLLENRRKLVIIEDNDSNSEETEIKDEIKSEAESDSETNTSDVEIKEESSSEENTSNEVDSDVEIKEETTSEEENENTDEETQENNAGWADSISKILRTKKPKNKRTLVLSKAKKLTDVIQKPKPQELGFQIDGEEVKDEKPDTAELETIKTEDEPPKKKLRKDVSSVRTKPNILEKDRERTLSKIATKGVVQLFNAVRQQQKDIDYKLEEAGPLERKRENAMKSIDKRAFLDVLMQKKSEKVDSDVKKDPKTEKWDVFREDFMMGAKMKDWDKEDDEESENEVEELSDSD